MMVPNPGVMWNKRVEVCSQPRFKKVNQVEVALEKNTYILEDFGSEGCQKRAKEVVPSESGWGVKKRKQKSPTFL